MKLKADRGRTVASIDYDTMDELGIAMSDVKDNCEVWPGDRIEIRSEDGDRRADEKILVISR